jgi:hypothetical protein
MREINRMKKAISAAILLFVLGFCVTNAKAELITISLSATVNYARDDGGYLEGKIIEGSIITGVYKYESTTSDYSQDDPIVGHYWHYSSPAGVFLTVGGFNFSTNPDNVNFLMGIGNNTPGAGNDSYWFSSYNNLSLSNDSSVDSIWWSLQNPDGTVFSSDALPAAAPVLSQWQANVLDIEGEGGVSSYG